MSEDFETYTEDGYWELMPYDKPKNKTKTERELSKTEEWIIDLLAIEEGLRRKFKDYPYAVDDIPECRNDQLDQLAKLVFLRIMKYLENKGLQLNVKYTTREPYRTILQHLLVKDLWDEVTDGRIENLDRFVKPYFDFLARNMDWIADFTLRLLENKHDESELISYAKAHSDELPDQETVTKMLQQQLSKEQLTKNEKQKTQLFDIMNLLAKKIAEDKAQKQVEDAERMKPIEEKTEHTEQLTTQATQDLIRRLKTKSQGNQNG